MTENEQQLGRQPKMEPRALHGINTLIGANKREGQIDHRQVQLLVEGLHALADLPQDDFKRIVEEQSGESKAGKKRLA